MTFKRFAPIAKNSTVALVTTSGSAAAMFPHVVRLALIRGLFGHTDPQYPIPIGGRMRIDGETKRVWVCKG